MPTDAELTELRNNCIWAWITQNGVNGYQVISKINGNSIFLPVAGYLTGNSYMDGQGVIWSKSLYSDTDHPNPYQAWAIDFWPSGIIRRITCPRILGLSVRPVCP